MAKKPKLIHLESLFNSKNHFSLTEAQNEAKTGARLPKDSSYLLNRSALAKECKKRNFRLSLQEKIVSFERM